LPLNPVRQMLYPYYSGLLQYLVQGITSGKLTRYDTRTSLLAIVVPPSNLENPGENFGDTG